MTCLTWSRLVSETLGYILCTKQETQSSTKPVGRPLKYLIFPYFEGSFGAFLKTIQTKEEVVHTHTHTTLLSKCCPARFPFCFFSWDQKHLFEVALDKESTSQCKVWPCFLFIILSLLSIFCQSSQWELNKLVPLFCELIWINSKCKLYLFPTFSPRSLPSKSQTNLKRWEHICKM